MKNQKIYFVLLVLGVILGGRLSVANANPLSDVMPIQTSVQAFSVAGDRTASPCEQASTVDIANFTQATVSVNIKDFHDYIDNPVTKNRRIERQVVSYLYFNQTFLASESLSRLRRFNI